MLLAPAESRVDLVMNSLAAAFVVELDDMVIDVDDDGVKDFCFEVVRSELLESGSACEGALRQDQASSTPLDDAVRVV